MGSQQLLLIILGMIVVGIMGIVMAMSVPIVYKVWRKAPMRKAVSDIVEVCSHARARAIMQGSVTEVPPRAHHAASFFSQRGFVWTTYQSNFDT